MEKENKPYLDVETINRLIKQKGITEKQFAQLIDVAPQTAKNYLSGKPPKMIVFTAMKIAKALAVDASVILKQA